MADEGNARVPDRAVPSRRADRALRYPTLLAAVAALALLALVSNVPGAVPPPVTVLLSTGPAAGNGTFNASYLGASANGSRVFFETAERLVSADTDSQQDVYERSGGATTLVSTGPAGGNGDVFAYFVGASADGSRVFFQTGEQLVSLDRDARHDLYMRSAGTTTLVTASSGPAVPGDKLGGTVGNGNFTAGFVGASADGTRVFFVTVEKLVSGDTDKYTDIYKRSGGTITLVTPGTQRVRADDGDPMFLDASTDGSRVFFKTREGATNSIWERSGGATTLVSQNATFEGASADGSRVFFEKSSVGGRRDVYMRSGGTTTLVSTGPTGGNGAFDAAFRGASADGTRVFFETHEQLVNDLDFDKDVYERSGGNTKLISGSGFGDYTFLGASADGTRVFFRGEFNHDVYERSGDTTTLLWTGSTGASANLDAKFLGASADGTRVLFETAEKLRTTDTDNRKDIYVRAGGTTKLVSTTTGAGGGNGDFDAEYAGASADGFRVLFETRERLAGGDTDLYIDVYQRVN